jgi:hypothetical protein
MKNAVDVLAYENLGWTLNPGSTFPLTLIGTDKAIVVDIKRILDQGYSEQVVQKLTPLMMHHQIKCKEIEDYVNIYKPIYQTKIDHLIKNSHDWKDSDEEEREDILSEFEQSAIKSLDIQPWICEVDVLFAWPDVMIEYYYRQIASLLSHTYTRAKKATEEKIQLTGPDYRDLIKSFEILPAGDDCTCPYCKRLAKKKYSIKEYPNTPLHLGCRCGIIANT